MSKKLEELELVELGNVSQETKGWSFYIFADSPPTSQPNRRPKP